MIFQFEQHFDVVSNGQMNLNIEEEKIFFPFEIKPQKELFNSNGCDCVLTGITMKFFSKKAKSEQQQQKYMKENNNNKE